MCRSRGCVLGFPFVTSSRPSVEPTTDATRLPVVTRPIADPEELLARLPVTDPVAWVRNGEGLIGWGVAASISRIGGGVTARAAGIGGGVAASIPSRMPGG